MTDTMMLSPETLRRKGYHDKGCPRYRRGLLNTMPKDCTCWVEACANAWASELARREAAAAPCEWVEDNDGIWNTGCGNAFVFIDGGPADNHVRFCAYCGRPLVPVLAASLEKGEL